MGLKERRKKIMALMLAACVAGTSVVPVAASDVSVFSDGTDASPEAFDSADVDSANGAATKTVKINYYSEEEKKQIAEVDYTVDKDATSVNTSKLTAPKGYELVLSGDLAINDGYVYAAVRKVATTKTVKINYYSEEEKKQIAEVEFTVDKDATSVNTSKLTAPEGYELVLSGDLAINDGYVYAAVRKVATTKTVKINFYCPDEKKQIAEPKLKVAKDATSVNTSKLTVPKGYELVEVGDLPIRDGYVYAEVRKAVTTKGITVVYQDRKGNVIKTAPMTVDKDATYINTGKLTAPVILITHYMEEVVHADKVYVMDNGEVVMQGTPREIFSQVETLKEYRLDVPQVTLLAHELHKAGVDVPEGILTTEELVNALCQ